MEPACQRGLPITARAVVGVAGGVPALQPGLVDPQPAKASPLGEEPLVGGEPAAIGVGVQLGAQAPTPSG